MRPWRTVARPPGRPFGGRAWRGARAPHLRFVPIDNAWDAEDLGSRNGTLLNDQPLTRARLHDGDVLQVGRSVLRLCTWLRAQTGAARAAVFTTCPSDCMICGDGVCGPGEPGLCPFDCPVCGDGFCSAGEVFECPSDCWHCGVRECELPL